MKLPPLSLVFSDSAAAGLKKARNLGDEIVLTKAQNDLVLFRRLPVPERPPLSPWTALGRLSGFQRNILRILGGGSTLEGIAAGRRAEGFDDPALGEVPPDAIEITSHLVALVTLTGSRHLADVVTLADLEDDVDPYPELDTEILEAVRSLTPQELAAVKGQVRPECWKHPPRPTEDPTVLRDACRKLGVDVEPFQALALVLRSRVLGERPRPIVQAYALPTLQPGALLALALASRNVDRTEARRLLQMDIGVVLQALPQALDLTGHEIEKQTRDCLGIEAPPAPPPRAPPQRRLVTPVKPAGRWRILDAFTSSKKRGP